MRQIRNKYFYFIKIDTFREINNGWQSTLMKYNIVKIIVKSVSFAEFSFLCLYFRFFVMIFHISIFQTFFSDFLYIRSSLSTCISNTRQLNHYSYHFHRCWQLAIFFRFFLCLRSKHKRIVFSVHVACVPTVGHITKVRVDLLHYRNIQLAYQYFPSRYFSSENFHSDFFATLAGCASSFSDIPNLFFN